jgi:hypothetical protein
MPYLYGKKPAPAVPSRHTGKFIQRQHSLITHTMRLDQISRSPTVIPELTEEAEANFNFRE